jgi:hypothetical protein
MEAVRGKHCHSWQEGIGVMGDLAGVVLYVTIGRFRENMRFRESCVFVFQV